LCPELSGLVAYAVVFGSRVSGTARRDSDVDVGLRPRPGRSLELLRMLPEVAVTLAERSGVPLQMIDVAVLDVERAESLPFLYRALAGGEFVCGDRRLYVEDLARVASMYADFRVQLAKVGYMRRYAEKYAEGCGGVARG